MQVLESPGMTKDTIIDRIGSMSVNASDSFVFLWWDMAPTTRTGITCAIGMRS